MSELQRMTELEERVAALERIIHRVGAIDPDALYTPADAAGFLRCGKTNVYDLLMTGLLARTCVGAGSRGLRVKGSDLLAFLDERREGGPSPAGSFKYLKL